jgi:hypothetical protein
MGLVFWYFMGKLSDEEREERERIVDINLSNKRDLVLEKIDNGHSLEDICLIFGFDEKEMKKWCKREGIGLSSDYEFNLGTKEIEIENMFERGIGREEISDMLCLKSSEVRKIIENRGRNIRRNRREIFERKLEQGCDSLKDLCLHMNFKSPSGLYLFCKDEDLEFPDHLNPWGYRPEIDSLIEAELNQNEIAMRIGLSRQMISLYLINSLMIKRYEEIQERNKPESIMELRKSRCGLVTLLNLKRRELDLKGFAQENDVDRDGFAYKKLCEFRRENPRSKAYSNEQLYEVFLKYQVGLDGDEKPTYQDMADVAGLKYYSDVQKILRYVGLKPFNEGYYNSLSVHQNEAIRKGLKMRISYGDIAYVVGCTSGFVSMCHDGNSKEKRKSFFAHVFKDISREKLSYRVADQIYEAKDAGFSDEEVLELVDKCNPKKIDYAIEHREEIKGFFDECKRIMFPNREIDRRYLS